MYQGLTNDNTTAYNEVKVLLKSAVEAFRKLPSYQQQQMLREIAQEEAMKPLFANWQQYR